MVLSTTSMCGSYRRTLLSQANDSAPLLGRLHRSRSIASTTCFYANASRLAPVNAVQVAPDQSPSSVQQSLEQAPGQGLAREASSTYAAAALIPNPLGPDFPPMGTPGMPKRATPLQPAPAPVPPESSEVLANQIVQATSWQELQMLYTKHRTYWEVSHMSLAWSRLPRVTPAQERSSPGLTRFVDMLACATQDHVPALGYEALPHVLWSIAKLKTGMHVPAGASLTSGGGTQQQAHAGHMHVSGMVMSFVKALSAEAHLGLGGYDLTQLRRLLSALLRLGARPGAAWLLCADKRAAALLPGCTDPKALASVLVSFASLGHLCPSPYLREAACGAVRACFMLAQPAPAMRRPACGVLWSCALMGLTLYDMTVKAVLEHIRYGLDTGEVAAGAGAAAGCSDASSSSSSFQQAHALGTHDPQQQPQHQQHQHHAPHAGPQALDYAQVLWALARFEYGPSPQELSCLLQATHGQLQATEPVLLSSMLWALADMRARPPQVWADAAFSAYARQREQLGLEATHALLHSAAALDMSLPAWVGAHVADLAARPGLGRELRALPDASLVDLVKSLHALELSAPVALLHALEDECNRRLERYGGSPRGGSSSSDGVDAAVAAPCSTVTSSPSSSQETAAGSRSGSPQGSTPDVAAGAAAGTNSSSSVAAADSAGPAGDSRSGSPRGVLSAAEALLQLQHALADAHAHLHAQGQAAGSSHAQTHGSGPAAHAFKEASSSDAAVHAHSHDSTAGLHAQHAASVADPALLQPHVNTLPADAVGSYCPVNSIMPIEQHTLIAFTCPKTLQTVLAARRIPLMPRKATDQQPAAQFRAPPMVATEPALPAHDARGKGMSAKEAAAAGAAARAARERTASPADIESGHKCGEEGYMFGKGLV